MSQRTFGLYRRTFGTEIVESFYDWDLRTIGPYKVVKNLLYVPERNLIDTFNRYRYYDYMQKNTSALAVFNVNNFCFGVISRTHFFEEPYSIGVKLTDELISCEQVTHTPQYTHIGYCKTYQKCKAVYVWPWYLVANIATGEIYDHAAKLDAVPVINPPLSLYKELINTNHNAVYMDAATQRPIFID